ncbi:MAG TPA: outer membrane beta-barrel protein [Ferruginibacter sp.]|nr:outer membrane beta-barrel protein [Ferruginibacter sp.]
MQYVNDDMDDLFRRAAEGYSLDTSSGDFNEVMKKLQAEKNIPHVDKSITDKRKWLLLLLLIPFVWVCNNYFLPVSPGPAPLIAKTPVPIHTNEPANENGQAPPMHSVPPGMITISTPISKIQLTQPASSFMADKTSQPVNAGTLPVSSINSQANELYDEPVLKTGNMERVNIAASPNAKAVQIPTIDIRDENKSGSTKEKQQKKKNFRRFYAGIIISPDISTVKFQSVKNAGIGFGILAGYQFNKRVSAESGVSWDKKYYYSKGEYANSEHAYIPADAKLINVTGHCRMIEIPLNVKYDFKQKGHHNYSVTAGVSSYIMKSESYDYLVERNNYRYKKSLSYKNTQKDYTAIINLAAGYNLSFGKGNAFRAEPYIKMPLKGTGVTGLPIMSMGINIGVTKRIL